MLGLVAAAVLAPALSPHDPHTSNVAHALEPPGAAFWLGTDALGQDIFSRVLHGARVSLVIALCAVGLACLLGVPLGAVSGYAGGRLDAFCMRLVDVLMALS